VPSTVISKIRDFKGDNAEAEFLNKFVKLLLKLKIKDEPPGICVVRPVGKRFFSKNIVPSPFKNFCIP
jgi:hypothetical protein